MKKTYALLSFLLLLVSSGSVQRNFDPTREKPKIIRPVFNKISNASGAPLHAKAGVNLANKTTSEANKALFGTQVTEDYGASVSSAGDVNGDGYSDVIIGAPRYSGTYSGQGAAFIYYGSSTGINTLSQTLTVPQANAQFGSSVATAGDINGDGFSDVIIGAVNYKFGQQVEGAAFIYYGGPTGLNAAVEPLRGYQSNAAFGFSVSSAGDVDNDGFSDVIVGSFGYDQGVISNIGACYVFHGSSGGINHSPAQTLKASGPIDLNNSNYGFSVAGAGDVNGDGFSDIIVGAPGYDLHRGASFVYQGSSGGIVTLPITKYEGVNKETDPFNPVADAFGSAVSSAGDVNGDGYSDIAIGVPGHPDDVNPNFSSGMVVVYKGGATGPGANPAYTLKAPPSVLLQPNFGSALACAGDINGDGFGDLMVGSPNYDMQNEA